MGSNTINYLYYLYYMGTLWRIVQIITLHGKGGDMTTIKIKKIQYKVTHTVKNSKKYSLHLLQKDGKDYALAVYPDHYRLYQPLGRSLPVTKEKLSDIVLEFGNGKPRNLFELNVKG